MSDMASTNWSETDASNSATPPNGFPEGMNPSDVNNSARANMGGLKRWYNRSNAIKTTGGTTTAYTLSFDVAESQYYAGEEFSFVVNATCGAAPSLNINSLGAQSIRKFIGGAWTTLAAGDLQANQIVRVRQNSSATSFDIVSAPALYVATSDPSGASTVDFTGIPSGINNLELDFSLTLSGADTLALRFFDNLGSIDTSTVYYVNGIINNSSSLVIGTATSATSMGIGNFGTSSPVSGLVTVTGIQRATRTQAVFMSGGLDTTNSFLVSLNGLAGRTANGPITGVRFLCTGGATMTGHVTMKQTA